MSDVLAKICADKGAHIARCKNEISLTELESRSKAAPPVRGFAAALAKTADDGGLALIAELKKASPSKGLIRADFDPPSLAHAYQAGGATCLSVLTDRPYFQGEDAFLGAARSAVDLPVLRKDFMLDPYQVVEARSLGADAILIILAAVSDDQARELEATALDHDMDVLAEIHDDTELTRALRLNTSLIGINNRNLKSLEVDLEVTRRLAPVLPAGRDVVCESGLHSHGDLARMADIGVRRFLVGESLMRRVDVAAATSTLLGLSVPRQAEA